MTPFERLKAETEAQVAVRPLPDCLTVPSTPDAAFLSMVLRDPTMWPAGFGWDYSDCNTCAVGLSKRLWPKAALDSFSRRATFGITGRQNMDIFLFAGGLMPMCEVTPEHVADALDVAIAAQVSK